MVNHGGHGARGERQKEGAFLIRVNPCPCVVPKKIRDNSCHSWSVLYPGLSVLTVSECNEKGGGVKIKLKTEKTRSTRSTRPQAPEAISEKARNIERFRVSSFPAMGRRTDQTRPQPGRNLSAGRGKSRAPRIGM